MRLMLRVFAPATDAANARAVATRLRTALSWFEPREPAPPQRYWKVPEWYEHTFELSPPSVATFDALVARAPGGWMQIEREEECDAVWNPGADAEFLLPEVVWAEALLVNEAQLEAPCAHVIYLRSNQIALSREPVADWRELQKLYADYMASLGPWTAEEILDHFSAQFGADEAQWPLRRSAIERFMTRTGELVLRSNGAR